MSLPEIVLSKLASSGLDAVDAEKLGIEYLTPEETRSAVGLDLEAMKIPYFNNQGRPTGFFRVRILGKKKGFAGQVKLPKYLQPKGTLSEVYLPPGYLKWDSVLDDPGKHLVITEGEFKAACASKSGINCIGLGGVEMWRQMRHGIEFLPQLADVEWEKRKVYVVFDSDGRDNGNVMVAANKLAGELIARGAHVTVAYCPSDESGDKVGLDDYIIKHGVDNLWSFLKEQAESARSRALHRFNQKYVYIEKPGMIVSLRDSRFISHTDLTTHLESNAKHKEIVPTGRQTKDGKATVKVVEKFTAQEWMKWEGRSQLYDVTFAPGGEQIVNGKWNTWTGWGCDPKPGDVTPWIKMLDHLFTGADPAARKWFEQWCAYPLQHPGTKLLQAVIFQGTTQGTGKTLIGETIRMIYGKHGCTIKQKELKDKFNSWQENMAFSVGDEVSGSTARTDQDTFKNLITEREVRVNEKFLPTYTIPACCNFFFTTNHPDGFQLETSDRRNFVHSVRVGKAPPEDYAAYFKWLDKGGPSHLFHYLLNVDLTGYEPFGNAMDTEDKEVMKATGMSDLESFVADLFSNPGSTLRKINPAWVDTLDIVAPENVQEWYTALRGNDVNVKVPGVLRAISRLTEHREVSSRKLTTLDGARFLFILRNEAYWKTATEADVLKHYNDIFKKVDSKY